MVNLVGLSIPTRRCQAPSMTDDDLRRDVAFALRRHIRSKRPSDADEARIMAAVDVLKHLRLCGYEIRKVEKAAALPTTL